MKTDYIKVKTHGKTDIVNITPLLKDIVARQGVTDGVVFLNVIGSTAALTTMEYESGLERDVHRLFEAMIPYRADYAHNAAWHDDNGHSHLRSTFIKTNFFVPVTDGELDLGTWQQVVLLDFDTRPRERKIVIKILT